MKRVLANNVYMLKYIFEFCKYQIAVTILVSVLLSGQNVANILLTKNVIDSITNKIDFSYTIFYVCALTAVMLVSAMVSSIMNNVIVPRNSQIIQEGLQKNIFRKSKAMHFKYFDNAGFYDKFSMVIMQSSMRAQGVLKSFSTLLGNLFTIGGLFSLLALMNPSLIGLVAISAIITTIIRFFSTKIQYKYYMKRIPIDREIRYIERIFYLREYAQEIRHYSNFYEILNGKYSNAVKTNIKLINTYGVTLGVLQALSSFSFSLLSAIAMLLLSYTVFRGEMQISDYVVLMTTSMQLFGQINVLLGNLSEFYDHSLYIDNFREFVENSDSIIESGTIELKRVTDISFKNVWFTYENNLLPTLKNICLQIKQGEKVAFVGTNGAGKSTLIKLITRIYDPCSGDIKLNGKFIAEYNINSLRDTIGFVLQEGCIFSISIAENVLMRGVDNSADEELVMNALKFAGIYDKIDSLPKKIYSTLTCEFDNDGVVLSGGEIQKLCIARAYAQNCSLLILDEPSSALDPISEKKVLESVLSLGIDKTVIFITHRMENAKHADMIYLFDEGQLIEYGKHEQLFKKRDKYYEMYLSQTRQANISTLL